MVAARTPRKLQADATRRRIFAAAAELFAARGYHDVTVAEIARRAHVAKGTFFVHFATKDAIVTELVRIQTRAARRARARVLDGGGTPAEALRATALMLGEQAGSSIELSRAVLAATLENAAVGGASATLFDEVFAEMCADSTAAFGDDRAARALMTSYLGAALHCCTSPRATPIQQVLTPLVDTHLEGFVQKKMEARHAPRRSPPGRPRKPARPRRRGRRLLEPRRRHRARRP
jgi:AcrR family transcriptional regulator